MRRHRFDPISLVFGALFAVIGGAFLFGNVDVASLPPALTWPVPLVVLGLVIIALALSGSRPERREVAASPGTTDLTSATTAPEEADAPEATERFDPAERFDPFDREDRPAEPDDRA